MPTLPPGRTVNKVEPVEEATVRSGRVGLVAKPWMINCAPGVVVPRLMVPDTARLEIVVVARVEVAETESGPKIVWLAVVVALPLMVIPAKVGVDVLVRDWLRTAFPSRERV